MQRQYLELKRQYPDCIMMFRLGDFFEMFNHPDIESVIENVKCIIIEFEKILDELQEISDPGEKAEAVHQIAENLNLLK